MPDNNNTIEMQSISHLPIYSTFQSSVLLVSIVLYKQNQNRKDRKYLGIRSTTFVCGFPFINCSGKLLTEQDYRKTGLVHQSYLITVYTPSWPQKKEIISVKQSCLQGVNPPLRYPRQDTHRSTNSRYYCCPS
jgi:hypothetical protein